jgi:hypothetical protein
MHQRMCLTAYKESATTATNEIERLRHENAILRSGAHPPSEQDRELQEVYRCCSTSLVRRWISVPTESSTLSATWRRRMPSLRRGRR